MAQASALLLDIAKRFFESAVLWSWAYNGLRVASGLLLLPLLLQALRAEELGMYYVFLRISALVPIIDFGFSATVGRFVSYATGGATELRAQGLVPKAGCGPNKALLWQLLFTYQSLYRRVSAVAFILLGTWGTYNVSLNAKQTADPHMTWIAWGVTLAAAVFEVYAGWWNMFLRSMNEILISARLAVLGYAIQLLLAAGLLLAGGGLLSVPLAALAGSAVQRVLSRKTCLRILGPALPHHPASMMHILWPNSWRLGLQYLSGYLGASVPALIFAAEFGTATFARYGLSLQIITFCASMASVWTMVHWPLVGQYQTTQNYAGLHRVLRPATWLQTMTFIGFAAVAVLAGPWLLDAFGAHKQLVPIFWLSLLALNSFLELHLCFWTTLLSTENRIPWLWPMVCSNVISLVLFLFFVHFTHLEYGMLILPPLLTGLAFNYWYWAVAGARSLRISWLRFVFADLLPKFRVSACRGFDRGRS